MGAVLTAKETPQSAFWRSVKEGLGVMAGLAARHAVHALTSGKLAVETAPTVGLAVESFVGAVLTAKKILSRRYGVRSRRG